MLHLVDDGAGWDTCQKPSGVGPRELSFVRRFQAQVGLVGKRRPAERRFSGLPRPRQREDWVPRGLLAKGQFQRPSREGLLAPCEPAAEMRRPMHPMQPVWTR